MLIHKKDLDIVFNLRNVDYFQIRDKTLCIYISRKSSVLIFTYSSDIEARAALYKILQTKQAKKEIVEI